MNVEYFIIVVLGFLCLGLFSIGVSRMLRLLIGNYIAGITCLFLSLGIHLFMRFLDQEHESLKFIQEPDALLGFLSNNYALVIVTTYLILIIISFRSTMMNAHVGIIKKIFYYIFLTPLAAVSIMLTVTVLIVGPDLLTINGFDSFVTSLNIGNKRVRMLVDFSPFVIVFTPMLILILSYRVGMPKISLPKMDIKKKKKKGKNEAPPVIDDLSSEDPAPVIESGK